MLRQSRFRLASLFFIISVIMPTAAIADSKVIIEAKKQLKRFDQQIATCKTLSTIPNPKECVSSAKKKRKKWKQSLPKEVRKALKKPKLKIEKGKLTTKEIKAQFSRFRQKEAACKYTPNKETIPKCLNLNYQEEKSWYNKLTKNQIKLAKIKAPQKPKL